MFNVLAIIDIASGFLNAEGWKEFISDARILYGVYTSVVNAKKFDPAMMIKDGNFWTVILAVNRVSGALLQMQKDPTKKKEIEEELASV